MHKFTSNKLEIDLSDLQLTINEENNWFLDRFFVKFSYPFSLEITDELLSVFGDLRNHNASILTHIEGEYVYYNKVEKAILAVDSIDGEEVTLSLKYGYEEFPNFDKKLQEIVTDKLTVDNIYYYANFLVNKGYPQTNINFPQLITNKYNREDTTWKFFEGRLNHRKDGFFLENTVSDNDEMVNRNVMHPCVYLMHVLVKGFASTGFTLSGEFLSNELLPKILLYTDKDQFVKREVEDPLELIISNQDQPEWTYTFKGVTDGHWKKTISIPKRGKYNIIAQLDLEGVVRNGRPGGYGLKHNNNYIKQEQFGGPKFIVLDEEIYVNQENETVSLDLTSVFTPGRDHVFAQLSILPIYFLADDGTKETGIINSNYIDFGKALPDITFGQLFTAVSNLFNLDITITDQVIHLNYINKQVQQNNLIDLSKYEKKNVPVSFNHNDKYLLKYEENEDEKVLDRILVDAKETKVVKPSETLPEIENTISIDAFPLQFEENTVIAKDNGSDKINLLIYDGLIDNNNYAQIPTPLHIPSIHNKYYKDWLNNRAVAKSFDIDFSALIEDAISINIKDRVFMYNNIHIIKNFSKQQVSRDIVEIEMKTETLKVD